MSTRDEVRVVFEQAVQQVLADNLLTHPVEFENLPFDTPAKERGTYVSGEIKWVDSNKPAIGNTRQDRRHWGMFIVHIYVPEGTGTKGINDLAELYERAFSSQSFPVSGGAITTHVADLHESPPKGGWYCAAVTAVFYADTCR